MSVGVYARKQKHILLKLKQPLWADSKTKLQTCFAHWLLFCFASAFLSALKVANKAAAVRWKCEIKKVKTMRPVRHASRLTEIYTFGHPTIWGILLIIVIYINKYLFKVDFDLSANFILNGNWGSYLYEQWHAKNLLQSFLSFFTYASLAYFLW